MKKQNLKKKQEFSSCVKVDNLSLWESERNLAAKLISDFEGQNQSGPLEYWMAGRIAELLTHEQKITGLKAKEACRKECSSLIQRLKITCDEKNRSSTRNTIKRQLEYLTNEGGNNYWFRQPSKKLALNKRCDLTVLERDALIERLIMLHDEERDLILLLGTDDLIDSNDDVPDVEEGLLNDLRDLLEEKIHDLPQEVGLREKLKGTATREERLSLLCSRIRSLGREFQRLVKELESRA